MHDPLTVAFEIRYPWPWHRRVSGGVDLGRPLLLTIWHVDPARNYVGKHSADDSCDWSGSSRPLNVKEYGIVKALWDLESVVGNRPVYGSDLYPSLENPGALGTPFEALQLAVYGWRRRDRRWWQHPRFHVHHWGIQIHPLQKFKRWAFSRCTVCGGRFAWGEAPISGAWNSTGPLWFRSEVNARHGSCSATDVTACAGEGEKGCNERESHD